MNSEINCLLKLSQRVLNSPSPIQFRTEKIFCLAKSGQKINFLSPELIEIALINLLEKVAQTKNNLRLMSEKADIEIENLERIDFQDVEFAKYKKHTKNWFYLQGDGGKLLYSFANDKGLKSIKSLKNIPYRAQKLLLFELQIDLKHNESKLLPGNALFEAMIPRINFKGLQTLMNII